MCIQHEIIEQNNNHRFNVYSYNKIKQVYSFQYVKWTEELQNRVIFSVNIMLLYI